jgi:hypothetical protein
MGLFKKAVDIGFIGPSIASKVLTGKSLGSHAEKALGSLTGAGDAAPQFQPDIAELKEDIGAVRSARDAPIEGIRKSAQIGLDRAGQDLNQSLGQINAGSMGRFRGMQDAIAESGGLDAGTTERLARQQMRDSTMGQQAALSQFGDLRSDITMTDMAGQEARKDKALFSMPQLSAIPAQIQNEAAAANMRAKALADANQKGKMGGIGSLIGAGAGFAMGGPMGAMMGAGVGKGIFSS